MPSKKLPKYLRSTEIRSLLNAPHEDNIPDRLILTLMSNCGLRNSEVCNLEWDQFDFDDRTVIIREGKGGKDRVVPMDAKTLDLVLEYKDIHDEWALFDISERSIQRLVKKYAKIARIDRNVNPHMLRHTFAVGFLKAGGNLRTLQRILGHTSLTTTQIYLDITAQDVRAERDRVDLGW